VGCVISHSTAKEDPSAMDPPSTVLRAAEPTFDEGEVYARYLDQAAEGFFQFMLGCQAAEVIAGAFIQPGNDYSFHNVTFAECENVIVGMASTFTGTQRQTFEKDPLRGVEGRHHLRMSVITILCAPLLRIIDTIPDDDFYIQSIAVDAELRGAGVGSTLMDHIEERAAAHKSTRISLDVSAKNGGARRLYERRGFIVDSEWPTSQFVPTLFVRMTKRLQ
jgi:ribosomal protein S18 acetylase RimI-like enzyme